MLRYIEIFTYFSLVQSHNSLAQWSMNSQGKLQAKLTILQQAPIQSKKYRSNSFESSCNMSLILMEFNSLFSKCTLEMIIHTNIKSVEKINDNSIYV